MDTLLVALARVVPRRRRAAGAVGTVVTTVLGFGLAPLTRVPSADPCGATARELDGIWDGQRRQQLERHNGSLAASHVLQSQQRVFASLDQWREAWVNEREQVCRAREGFFMVPDRLELQDNCLAHQRQRVRRFVELLADVDAAELAEAVITAGNLPAPSACADDLWLTGVTPPSTAYADEVEALRIDLAAARDLRLLGRFAAASSASAAIDEAAIALGYQPLMAEARGERARVEHEAGAQERSADLYQSAIDIGEVHHHDLLVAELMLERAELELFTPDHLETAKQWLHRAAIAHERAGITTRRAKARLTFARGRVAELEHRLDHAEALYRSAAIELASTEDAELPTYLDALARVVGGDEALELRRQALDFALERFGPRHPRAARWLFNYATTAMQAGHDAEHELELAAEIWTETLQQPHRRLGKARLILAFGALSRGELDRAEAHARALAAIHERTLALEHPDRGEADQVLATIESIRGNADRALTHARAAIAAFERSNAGLGDARAVSMRGVAADQLLALGRLDEAAAEFQRILLFAVDPQQALRARLGLTEVALRRDQLDEADAQLRAVDSLGLDSLAEYELTHAVLTAILDLRRRRLTPEQVAELTVARERSPFTDEQVARWVNELELSSDERRRLAL